MATVTLPAELCEEVVIDLDVIFGLVAQLPGGIAINPKFDPGTIPNFGAAISALLGELGAAMAPLMPIFRILDCVIAAFECIKAIPGSIGPPPDPSQLIKAIAKLTKAIGFVVGMIPQISVPIMVKSVLNAVIVGLRALQEQLDNLILVSADFDLKTDLALSIQADFPTGSAALIAHIDCAKASFDVQQEATIRSMCPINHLLALLSIFLQLIGQPAIGPFEIGVDLEPARDAVGAAIEVLEGIRDALPGFLDVPAC